MARNAKRRADKMKTQFIKKVEAYKECEIVEWCKKRYCCGHGVNVQRGMAKTGIIYNDWQVTIQQNGNCDRCCEMSITITAFDGSNQCRCDELVGWTVKAGFTDSKAAEKYVKREMKIKGPRLTISEGEIIMISEKVKLLKAAGSVMLLSQ